MNESELKLYNLDKCRYCSGKAVVNCLQVECKDCGARTKNFTNTLGEFQREQRAAISAWEYGTYWPKDDPKWSKY